MTRIEFVKSQVEYYSSILGSGPYHSKNLIHGLLLQYSQELAVLEKENKF